MTARWALSLGTRVPALFGGGDAVAMVLTLGRLLDARVVSRTSEHCSRAVAHGSDWCVKTHPTPDRLETGPTKTRLAGVCWSLYSVVVAGEGRLGRAGCESTTFRGLRQLSLNMKVANRCHLLWVGATGRWGSQVAPAQCVDV